MGNRSTPSAACAPCREKRRKCSLERPWCAQCFRAGTRCHGYRDAFTLRLRDETIATARRAQGTKGWGKPQLRNSASPVERKEGISQVAPACVKLPYSVKSGDIVQQSALTFFMNVWSRSSTFHFLPKHYSALRRSASSIKDDPSLLDLAISTPSLALLGMDMKEPSLVWKAYELYATVLARTQNAIADHRFAVLDITLACVLLLGLFEALVFRGRRDTAGWDSHIRGAAALLQLRGKSQSDHALGRHLYLYTSNTIIKACGLRSVEIPLALRELQDEMSQSGVQAVQLTPIETLDLRVDELTTKVAHYRAGVKSKHPSRLEQLERVKELGSEADHILASLREQRPFLTIAVESCGGLEQSAYGDSIYTYSAPCDARQWNTVRFLRLFAHECTYNGLRCLETRAETLEAREAAHGQREKAWQYSQEIIDDMLHTVPYLLNVSGAPRVCGTSVLLDLAAIAVSDVSTQQQKRYACEQIRFCHENLNCPLAQSVAEMAVEAAHLEQW